MSSPVERFEVRYWGVRASIPTPGPDTVRYGGNTTCIEVRCDEQTIVIDTGTGVRGLGDTLMAQRGDRALKVAIIYSHLHMDHIQGFPFFAPIYEPSTALDVYSPRPANSSTREFLGWHMAFPWFPVDLEMLEIGLEFHEVLPGDTFQIGAVTVRTCPMNHPGGAMGIRIEHRDRAFVHASDLEHPEDGLPPELTALAAGADYLSYDSTYIEGEEYEHHKGWGHSTWQTGCRVADAAGVRTFVAFHHDPSHDDDFMDDVAAAMQGARPGSLVAREGMVLDLLSETVTIAERRRA
jgi:phosphoribosyl 1,2-cyclic phosphodiesterase